MAQKMNANWHRFLDLTLEANDIRNCVRTGWKKGGTKCKRTLVKSMDARAC
jgi:hypothetical protein